ncbi:MAG: tRNA pseudouridine(38-40) synthase TruA [Actinomycetes bacterium]
MEPAAPDLGDGGLPAVRVRLDIAYDGSAFAGWARQPGLRTVQGELERGLQTVLRLPVPPELTVAGRTDAGVHARGQVAHLDVRASSWAAVGGRSRRAPAESLHHRLAGVLPDDVRVTGVTEVPEAFDARFSALWRRYVYRVCDDPSGLDPLTRGWVTWHARRLDVRSMNDAAQVLLGEQDFAAFCRRREGATTVRTLRQLAVERCPDGVVAATVVADAFCHSMVRSLMGALLSVGEGQRDVAWVRDILAGRQRHPSVHVAAAKGLTLEEVGYPPAAELAAQAERTRRRRPPLDGAGTVERAAREAAARERAAREDGSGD